MRSKDEGQEYVWDEVGAPLDLGESQIVWLEGIENLDYVREEVTEYAARRTGSPFRKGYHLPTRLVGYSELLPSTKSGPYGFKRRYFLIKPHDRFYQPDWDRGKADTYKTGAPVSGVDPRSVEPNVKGRKTPKSELGVEE
jgi:hypothetical protein